MRIVFDLDGTLIDSAPDIHAAVNAMLDEMDRPHLSQTTVTSFVGNGLPKLVELVIEATGLEPSDHEKLTAIVLHHYMHPKSHLTAPYPGVINAMKRLKADGHRIGLCTNKLMSATHAELERLNLTQYFEVVAGGDTYPTRKPDPAPLRGVFDQLGTGDTLFVGDSEVDAATAQNADVPFALYTRGYRKSEVEDLPHTMHFSDFAQLLTFVQSKSG